MNASEAGPTRVNGVLRALSRPESRRIVRHLQESSSGTATLETLARTCAGERRRGADDPVTVRLHHVALPTLDETGVLDYDARSSTVRYRGDRTAEAVLEAPDRTH